MAGEPSSPPQRGIAPQFSVHICCGQMTRWVKMPLGRKAGFDPSDIVLDGDPSPPPQHGGRDPPIFGPYLLWPNGWMGQDTTCRPRYRLHCVRWGPSSPSPKGAHPQFSAHVCCGQTAGWIEMALGIGGPWSRQHCAR